MVPHIDVPGARPARSRVTAALHRSQPLARLAAPRSHPSKQAFHPSPPPQIVVDGFAIPQRVRLRHIPGSPPLWLLGHTLAAKARHKMFLYDMWEEMGARHGKVFKWFWGTQPIITIRGAPCAMRRAPCAMRHAARGE